MRQSDKEDITSDELELDFDESSLNEVEISDQNIAAVDKETEKAKKAAKKTAKKLLTPEERKRLLRKRILIGAITLAVGLLILLAIPATRWPLLNTIGFRGDVVLTVEDSNNQPVTNAVAKFDNGLTATTDKFGRAYFQNTYLGKQGLVIQKNGYGDKRITLLAKLGTTKQTENLKIIGIKIDIDIKDWLSNKAIEAAQVSADKSNAISDSVGRASLVIPPTDKKMVSITVSAPGYLTKTLEAETNIVSREVALVSAQKNYFISKRDGKFDLFSSNLDGSDQRKIIEATGKEEDSLLQFSINRNNKQAVLVANRDGKSQSGRLIAGIYAVDLDKSSLRKIDEGSDIQLFDWSGDNLVYSKSAAELKYDDPAFSRLMNFNSASGKLSQLASANYFSAALVAQNKAFYVPADAYRQIENGILTSQDVSSGSKKTYLPEKQINYITRSSYQLLDLQDATGAGFELQLSDGKVKATDRRPNGSLQVAGSPNSQLFAWSDRRDGQGALIVRLKDGTEKTLLKAPGLTNPIRFVTDDLIIIRVATSEETADYVASIVSGKLKKIVDVSNVGNNRQSGF